MNAARLLRHLATGRHLVRRCFPAPALAAIESAIAEGERHHEPEIRFAVEAALDVRALWRDVTPRARAIALFGELRVWDTEHNTGVLIYLLLADRAVEIVADRGVATRVAHGEWETICHDIETELHAGRYESGALTGIRAVSELLARHFPSSGPPRREQSDRPLVL